MISQLRIPARAFNDCYRPLLDCATRYLVLYGGAGSGKSVFAVQRFVMRLFSRPICNLLVVRNVGDTNRNSTFALFLQVIGKWGLEKHFAVNKSELRITCTQTGNSVLFKGLDDVEKLKSITFAKGELTDIWLEEASEVPDEQTFNQLDVRLRGGSSKKQLVVTFNPVDVNHWLKRRFFDRGGPEVTVLHTTYQDNRFIDQDYRQLLESYRDTDPYYYDVYCRGLWGSYGKSIFDKAKISRRLEVLQNEKPLAVGCFAYDYDGLAITSIRWVDDPQGDVILYRRPKPGYPYVLGGDTAGEGSDYFTGQLIDNTTGEQVAVLRQQTDEDLYARQLYALGLHYNTALLAVETNFSTHPVRELERLRYPRLYQREYMDSFTHRLQMAFGFRTDQITRPVILAELVQLVRDHCDTLNDPQTLHELLTFVRGQKGRPEAQAGAHDDLVLALAIAHHARSQQTTEIRLPKTHQPSALDFFRQPPPGGSALGEGETEDVY